MLTPCHKCKNANVCKSPFKGDDIRECSNYMTNAIDWEQRRYEIAKAVLPVLIAQTTNTDGNFSGRAISYADALIEKLKKSKL